MFCLHVYAPCAYSAHKYQKRVYKTINLKAIHSEAFGVCQSSDTLAPWMKEQPN